MESEYQLCCARSARRNFDRRHTAVDGTHTTRMRGTRTGACSGSLDSLRCERAPDYVWKWARDSDADIMIRRLETILRSR